MAAFVRKTDLEGTEKLCSFAVASLEMAIENIN